MTYCAVVCAACMVIILSVTLGAHVLDSNDPALALDASHSIIPGAHAQDLGLATFHESAVVLVDRTGMHNATSSVTLQSVSTQELQIPPDLEERMRTDGRITAVILSNHNNCILGVSDQSCLLVNTARDPDASSIRALQDSAFEISEKYIADLNAAFDTDARFHSVFVHAGGSSESPGVSTGLPGAASGRTTVSVVYVMPMEDTDAMYEKVSAMLLPGIIRDSGGFYDAARTLSGQSGAKMSFSLVPLDSESLLQLKVVSRGSVSTPELDVIRPLDLMGLDVLERSAYFESGFYPLNSVVQVVVSSNNSDTAITGSVRGEISTVTVDGEKIPTDVKDAGWIFDPAAGKNIQAKYLFGEQFDALSPGDLEMRLNGASADDNSNDTSIDEIDIVGADTDEQIMVVIAVVAIAVAAAMFYMRGYSGRAGMKRTQ